MLSMNVIKHALCALLTAVVFITNGVIPNGYMLDRLDDSDRLVIRICTGGSSAARYALWDQITGEHTLIDEADLDSPDHQDHDNDDTDAMSCTVASQDFTASPKAVIPNSIKVAYAAFIAPYVRGLPLIKSMSPCVRRSGNT